MRTNPLLLSLAGSEPVEVTRTNSRYPHSVTVLVILPTGGVVDVSYGYPISFTRAVECAVSIHGYNPERKDFVCPAPLSTASV